MDPDAYKKYNKAESGAGLGVYKAPNGEELWANSFPAADAFVRQGFKYDRPLPSAEERRKVAPTAEESAQDNVETEKAAKAAKAKKEDK